MSSLLVGLMSLSMVTAGRLVSVTVTAPGAAVAYDGWRGCRCCSRMVREMAWAIFSGGMSCCIWIHIVNLSCLNNFVN